MASLLNMLRMGKKHTETTNTKAYIGNVSSAYSLGATMGCYKYGSYDNTFPNVTRISEAFAEIMPYAIDINGDRMNPQPQLVAAMYNPNKQMSGVQFFETLIVMALVHPTVYILCWHKKGNSVYPGGKITKDNISGFTFLESPSVVLTSDGHKVYRQGSSVYSENEVIEISLNVNPYSVTEGYSPSMASKKWSNIDDYIAEFQAGFFKNGAVPAGEFVITAPTVEAYNDIVDELQRRHRGAGSNNNVVYVHRPISSIDGAPMNAQIEWIPFAQANKDMNLQTLFEQANKKIDMDFGVPQEVKGYLQNSNYASVEVADYIFSRRVVYPKLVKVYAQFTHEMNRITGGLGYAISFDYEPPVLTETRQTQLNTLLEATREGYTLDSAVEALQLPKSFLKLQKAEETVKEDDRQDIQMPNEESNADQVQTSTKCVHDHKEKAVEASPKVQRAVTDYMQEQVDYAKEEKEFDKEKHSKAFALVLLAILLDVTEENGDRQYADGATMLNLNLDDLKGFEITEDIRTAYEKYLDEVSLSYTEDTELAIKDVLGRAEFEGWDYATTKEELQNIMNTNSWRVERLARTETHRSEQLGRLEAMKQLQKETDATIMKVWHVNPASPNPCEVCLSYDGMQLPLDAPFGDFFGGGDEPDAHPNCSCYLTFEIVEKEKTVKVVCPECGRYICESTGGNMKGVICANSHCKKHWDIEVTKGKIIAKEIK